MLDTNVVASAILWGGTPRLLLQAARDKRVELFTSTAMLAELTDILGRRKFARKIAASQLTIDQLVDGYAQLAALVRPVTTPRIAPDPDDDVVIGTALAAKADLIVTGDKPLLTVSEHQGVRIASVAQAIEIIEATGKS
ncbi:MAG: putative toxin-antitoxin system toxin component, PIN family [Betaproteobacteria bacterium]